MPTTHVTAIRTRDSNGEERVRYRTTVPASVVELLDLEGESVDWTVTDRGTIELQTVDEE
jgi:hypothetical protein